MAGSEKTGYANSKRILIENAYYMITPTEKTPREAVETYRDFVASLKALPLVIDYHTHDYVTAGISHLPHIIASSLVNLVKDEGYQRRHHEAGRRGRIQGHHPDRIFFPGDVGTDLHDQPEKYFQDSD